MKTIELESSRLSLFDHRDIDEIEDDYQAVIESGIKLPDGQEAEVLVQETFNQHANHNRDAFYHDEEIGCRETSL